MTQPPYVPPRDDDNFASQFPESTSDSPYSQSSYGESSYTEPVSSVSVGEGYSTGESYSTGQPSTTDVAKDQAGTVKDTAVEQGQHVAGVAKEQAGAVKDTALEQGQHVVGVAKEQAQNVAAEASTHVRDLLSEGLSEVRNQAGSQQKRLATAVHSLASELGSMASKSEQSGPLTNYAQEASRRAGELSHWLENAEPSELLDEVRSFARRRPAVFLGVSALAGVVVGRLTRGLVANAKNESTPAIGQTSSNYSTSDYSTPGYSGSDYSSAPQYGVETTSSRENISLQEVPTSGSGYGGTTDAPDYAGDDATLPYGTNDGVIR